MGDFDASTKRKGSVRKLELEFHRMEWIGGPSSLRFR